MPYDSRLRPCPFCDSTRVSIMHAVQQIHCWECSVDGPFQYSTIDRNEQEQLLIKK